MKQNKNIKSTACIVKEKIPKFCKICGGKLVWDGRYYEGSFNEYTGKQNIKKIFICSKDKFKGFDEGWYNNPTILNNVLTHPQDHGCYHI